MAGAVTTGALVGAGASDSVAYPELEAVSDELTAPETYVAGVGVRVILPCCKLLFS